MVSVGVDGRMTGEERARRVVKHIEGGGGEAVLLNGYNEAIVGVASKGDQAVVVAYDRARCIGLTCTRVPRCTREEAEEALETVRDDLGTHFGNRAPVFVEWVEDL